MGTDLSDALRAANDYSGALRCNEEAVAITLEIQAAGKLYKLDDLAQLYAFGGLLYWEQFKKSEAKRRFDEAMRINPAWVSRIRRITQGEYPL